MNLRDYLDNIIYEFKGLKSQAERALAQVSDEDFFRQIDNEANSIGIIVKHISGNQHSRWRDFLTTDGEKTDRYRDTEFELLDTDNRELVMNRWHAGWTLTLETVQALTPEDLEKTITIRGRKAKVYAAFHRQLTHYAAHIGEIVLLAKHFAGENWQTLSIAKGESEAYTKKILSEKSDKPLGPGLT